MNNSLSSNLSNNNNTQKFQSNCTNLANNTQKCQYIRQAQYKKISDIKSMIQDKNKRLQALSGITELLVLAQYQIVIKIYNEIMPYILEHHNIQNSDDYLIMWTRMYNGNEQKKVYPNFKQKLSKIITKQNQNKRLNKQFILYMQQFENNLNAINAKKIQFFDDEFSQDSSFQTEDFNSIIEINIVQMIQIKKRVETSQISQKQSEAYLIKCKNFVKYNADSKYLRPQIKPKYEKYRQWASFYIENYKNIKRQYHQHNYQHNKKNQVLHMLQSPPTYQMNKYTFKQTKSAQLNNNEIVLGTDEEQIIDKKQLVQQRTLKNFNEKSRNTYQPVHIKINGQNQHLRNTLPNSNLTNMKRDLQNSLQKQKRLSNKDTNNLKIKQQINKEHYHNQYPHQENSKGFKKIFNQSAARIKYNDSHKDGKNQQKYLHTPINNISISQSQAISLDLKNPFNKNNKQPEQQLQIIKYEQNKDNNNHNVSFQTDQKQFLQTPERSFYQRTSSPNKLYINSNIKKLSEFTQEKKYRKMYAPYEQISAIEDFIVKLYSVHFINLLQFTKFRQNCHEQNGTLYRSSTLIVEYSIKKMQGSILRVQITYINQSRQNVKVNSLYKIPRCFKVQKITKVQKNFILNDQIKHIYNLHLLSFPLQPCILSFNYSITYENAKQQILIPLTIMNFVEKLLIDKEQWMKSWQKVEDSPDKIQKNTLIDSNIVSYEHISNIFTSFVDVGMVEGYSIQQYGALCMTPQFQNFLIRISFRVNNLISIEVIPTKKISVPLREFIEYYLQILMMSIMKFQ